MAATCVRRFRPEWRWIVVFASAVAGEACSPENRTTVGQPPVAQPQGIEATLEVGLSRPATLPSGGQHRFQLDLPFGHAALLEATQDDVDLIVEITGPNSQEILTIDRLGILASERVCWTSLQSGSYKVDVRPYSAGGAYSLRLLHSRPETEIDRQCAEATRIFHDALAIKSTNAHEKLERAARLWTSAGEPLGATIAWRAAGDALEGAGFLVEAMERFTTAYSIAEEAELTPLQVNLGNRQGRALLQLDQLDRAAATLDDALTLARRTGDVRGEAAVLTNRGRVDWELGDAYRAQNWYRKALSLWRDLDDPVEIAQVLHNLGEALGTVDHHQEALDVLNEALELTREAGAGQREAGVLAAIAWVHHLRGASHEGLTPMRRALTLRRKAGRIWSEAGVLDRLGTLLLAAGDRNSAEDAYRQALTLAASLEDADGYVATIEASLGCLLVDSDRHSEADEFFARALDYFHRNVGNNAYAHSHTEYCRARLSRQRGEQQAAMTNARKALDIVDGLRERAREQGHRYRPIPVWQDYASLEVSLLIERFRETGNRLHLARAFEAADQTRARRLFELVVATRSGAESAASRSRNSRETVLQERLSNLAKLRTDVMSTSAEKENAATDLDVEIRRLQLEIETVRAAKRAIARDSGLLGSPQPVSVEETQALLGPDSVLLTYVLGTESSHLLAMTDRDLDVFDLPSQDVIVSHAEGLHAALKTSDKDDNQWLLVAERLGQILLPRAAVPADARRLMIIAQGALHYVPFSVLPTPRLLDTQTTPSNTRLVLDDFEVVTIPSASVLVALRVRHEGRPRPPKTVAVFADPVFSRQDPRFIASARPITGPVKDHDTLPRPTSGSSTPQRHGAAWSTSRGISLDRLPQGPLPRLPATADEADSIAALVAADQQIQFRDWQASKQAVLGTALVDYRILHFATHAWVDERFPELSGLLLSRLDGTGRSIDGGLYLHEIDSLHLASDLTVLSGCQTALGQQVRGDGLVGLTQGFFNAGSSQVLVSLWSVEDVAASKLMAEFYQQLLTRELTPAAALQRAQRWLRNQDGFAAPRYWAPFVLQGDG